MNRFSPRAVRPFATMAVAFLATAWSAAPAPAQSRPYGDEGPGVGDAYLSAPNNVTDFPAAEVRAVPAARARYAIAEAEHREAYTTLNHAVIDSRRAFEQSDAMASALEEEQQAYLAYEAARTTALIALRDDEKYQATQALRSELTDRIKETRYEQQQPYHPNKRIVSLASAKLDYAKAANEKELAVLAKDTDVTDARARLIRARKRVRELRQEFADELRTDETVLAARHDLTQKKIAKLAAEAYLAGVVEARDIALHYTYYLNRYNPYQVASYFPSYPYYYPRFGLHMRY